MPTKKFLLRHRPPSSRSRDSNTLHLPSHRFLHCSHESIELRLWAARHRHAPAKSTAAGNIYFRCAGKVGRFLRKNARTHDRLRWSSVLRDPLGAQRKTAVRHHQSRIPLEQISEFVLGFLLISSIRHTHVFTRTTHRPPQSFSFGRLLLTFAGSACVHKYRRHAKQASAPSELAH